MELDVAGYLGAVDRSVSEVEVEGQPARAITLVRSFATSVDDLWDALTNGERIPRWFLPISGELALGGRYQFEGNAGGVITECERPSLLAATWEFGGDVSWVEVRLSDDGSGSARLTLTHTMRLSDQWEIFGPGATGVGWEGGLVGLAL
ncbi:MAG: SRPBCC family protein, partial [Dehalococcoidia bacterium]|nr:SRPBCC family protein [Dehalococcoidia bacterium]